MVGSFVYRGAVAELQRACEKEGTSAAAHLHLGRAFIGLNKYDGAEKALVRAIEIGGAEVIEAHRYLATVCIEKGQNSRATDELEKYLLLTPKVKDADRIARPDARAEVAAISRLHTLLR
ncbi:MAG TPA: hypothetical protein VFQ92_16000 [Blastocatellia bacterium]|nr:hypothetical protein [Blastocatellia bacterium]